jgi:KUP system potassium uptake protein
VQVFSVSQMLLLAYQSVGVIYGDIGTSPLYVYSSTFTEAPNRADLMGALSLIIWSLTLMVTVKYILVILRADNDGEGGTFSTYSLLSRYVRNSVLQLHHAMLMRPGQHLQSRSPRSYLDSYVQSSP